WPWPGGWSRPTTARSASTTRAPAAASPSACRCSGRDGAPPVKVLVTGGAGGAGFIGSHVVDVLLAWGAEVRVVDSLDPSVHGEGAGPPDLDPRAELL